MRLPFVKRFDAYVLTEVLGPFLGGVIFFSFVLLMSQALRLAEFFIIHGISFGTLLEMIGLLTLSFMPTVLPVAFLIGVLVGFGRLSADSELVALKANGVSIFRLAVPVLVLSIFATAVSLELNLQSVPWSERTFKGTLMRISNTRVVNAIKPGTFTAGFFDLLIYADRVDPNTNRLYKVFLYDEREPKNPLTVVAQEGELVPVKTDTLLGAAVMLKLFRGNIHSNNSGEDSYQKIDFNEYRLYLKIDEGADTAQIKPRMIPYETLKSEIRGTPPDTLAHREYLAEFWRRYAVALSPILFVFLGIGYGTMRTRAVRTGAVLITLVVVVVYWSVQAWAQVLARNGTLPAPLAMQLPNILVGLASIQAFKSAAW